MNLSKIITSKYLYPLWRIGWLERTFFVTIRTFQKVRYELFSLSNFGFDVSKWQALIDFVRMKAYGALFVIVRAAHALTKDPYFDTNMVNAYGLLPLSVYHFYDPVFSPTEQANRLLSILEPHRHKIRRVWLDLEFWWSGNYSHPKHWKTYRDIIKSAGYRVGWYTRATWWDSRVGEYAAEFAKDPVWAAQYNTALTLIPRGWLKAMIWQKGTPVIGLEAGVSSLEIDENVWNDEFDFLTEWGAPTTPPQPGEAMKYIVVWDTGCNTRPAPNLNNDYIKTLPKGQEFDVTAWLVPAGKTKEQEEWGQLPDKTWVALTYAGTARAVLVEPAPEPEPQPEPEPGDEMATLNETIRYFADKHYQGLHEVALAIGDIPVLPDPGTEPPPPPSASMYSVYKVIERDANPNQKVKIFKTPTTQETNQTTIWLGGREQTVRVINRWEDVPEMVGWNDKVNSTELDRRSTYDKWACIEQGWIYNAAGTIVAFPDIFLAEGTVRAKYCWIERSNLGTKVG